MSQLPYWREGWAAVLMQGEVVRVRDVDGCERPLGGAGASVIFGVRPVSCESVAC